ncbi:helix-turn-helix domain-containing protein [Hyphococcus sp.]|uniref:helix-turn-helix domain-containing protein n=1 Tax=Hyphococcus sp. TaxID=2038636 RepID=UPI003CCB8096
MDKERSAYMGPRLRKLRRGLGLTQASMAEELGVSPSYIALIERNHRPLSADLLIKLAENYDLDIAAFASAEDKTFERLEAALADPIFSELSIRREDIQELLAANPALGEALATLYQSYRAGQRAVMEARADGGHVKDPVEDARQFIAGARNYFDDLDRAGEETASALASQKTALFEALSARLQNRHGLTVRVLPNDVMLDAYRRHDRHRKQVMISEALDQASRTFQLSLQLALIEGGKLLDSAVEKGSFENDAGRKLARAALANYYAAAIMLPYRRFLDAANTLFYDIEALGRRFGASFEQICHRLTTLQRPGAEGVPFFFLRFDAAGNVSKRFSGDVFPFAQYGGACPVWNIHETFRQPRKILTQMVQLPEGDAYFSIARTVHGGAGGFGAPNADRAVALGCDIKHAGKLIYTKNVDIETAPRGEIGVTCRLCSRPACAARAHPPLERRLIIDEYRRMAAPFSFAFD